MTSPVSSPGAAHHRQVRRLGLAGVGLAAATTVVYLIILNHEGDPLVNVFSVLLVMAELVATIGALTGNRRAISVGATILTILGLLGLASIGIPLLLGAGLLWASVAIRR